MLLRVQISDTYCQRCNAHQLMSVLKRICVGWVVLHPGDFQTLIDRALYLPFARLAQLLSSARTYNAPLTLDLSCACMHYICYYVLLLAVMVLLLSMPGVI